MAEIFNDIFDHIYVINLDRCPERRKHITDEFNRMGISNYQFFRATDANDPIINEMQTDGRVQSALPHKIINNPRLANWCSFIRVWQDIYKNKYKLALICEDDIKFTECASQVIQQLLCQNRLLKSLDQNKPILLRLGTSGYRSALHKYQVPRWETIPQLCNPCYAINWHAAKELLIKSHLIQFTSDTFTHFLASRDFQHYTAIPQLAHDLSWANQNASHKIFQSTIRN